MEKYVIIIFRTLLLYGAILVIFRLMGKREIGELSVLDLVVFIMMGELAVLAIESHEDPLLDTLVPILVLLIIQILLAYLSMKSRKARRLIDGKPSVIIKNGKIDEVTMRKHRYNFDDLLMQLRLKDVANIGDVEFAILETSGELSVVKKENGKAASYTIPFILDGAIQQDHLREIGKDEEWLRRELRVRGHEKIDDISFCSQQDGEFYIDYRDTKTT